MRPPRLNPPPLPHLRNLPPPPEEPADAAETPAAKTPDFDAPNVNPVELGHVEAFRTPDGKIDPTQIVDPAVAGDWEEQGCKG